MTALQGADAMMAGAHVREGRAVPVPLCAPPPPRKRRRKPPPPHTWLTHPNLNA